MKSINNFKFKKKSVKILALLVIIFLLGLIIILLTRPKKEDVLVWPETNGSISGSIQEIKWRDGNMYIVSSRLVAEVPISFEQPENFYKPKYTIYQFIRKEKDGSLSYVIQDPNIRAFALVAKDQIQVIKDGGEESEILQWPAASASVSDFSDMVEIELKLNIFSKASTTNVYKLDEKGKFNLIYTNPKTNYDDGYFILSSKGKYIFDEDNSEYEDRKLIGNYLVDVEDNNSFKYIDNLKSIYNLGRNKLQINDERNLFAKNMNVYDFNLNPIYIYEMNPEDIDQPSGYNPRKVSWSRTGEYIGFINGSFPRVINIYTKEYIILPQANEISLDEEGKYVALFDEYQVKVINLKDRSVVYETNITELMLKAQGLSDK